MTEETPSDTSDNDPADPADGGADPTDAVAQREIQERVTRLAFGGDPARFEAFVSEIAKTTPAGVDVILRGSSITGHKYGSDLPFDADGPGTSDLDVTFVGGDMVMLFREFHIPGVHSVPLSEQHPFASPQLAPLRRRLCDMVKRPVNLQATTSLVQNVRDATMDQPYLVLLRQPGEKEAGE